MMQWSYNPPARERICMNLGHHWHEIGCRRIPAFSCFSWPPLPGPDGTVEYIDYRCSACGIEQSDETLYSFVPY